MKRILVVVGFVCLMIFGFYLASRMTDHSEGQTFLLAFLFALLIVVPVALKWFFYFWFSFPTEHHSDVVELDEDQIDVETNAREVSPRLPGTIRSSIPTQTRQIDIRRKRLPKRGGELPGKKPPKLPPPKE